MKDAQPYKVMAKQNIEKGFKIDFCVECQFTRKSGGMKIQSLPIAVKGEPDCSSALQAILFQSRNFNLKYNNTADEDDNFKQVGNGFTTFFTENAKSYC